jgi:predicted O-methyltransferase YrrM
MNDRLLRLLRAVVRRAGRWCGDAAKRTLAGDFLSYPLWQLPGHYYSPLPEVEAAHRAATRAAAGVRPVDLELQEDRQLSLLERLAPIYGEIMFPAEPTPGWRFYHENNQYPYADAILLHLLLRHWRPARIVEVGSGYSTAVMIDTVERCLDGGVPITCIEPHGDRLRKVVGALPPFVTLIERPVQEVPLEVFDQLRAGDILFIDSTHVVKTGSDVVYELFEVLPRLRSGVRLHFHDICWPFEYPVEWVGQGRAWNEVYTIHAYLSHNRAFEVTLFNHMMLVLHRDWFAARMPRCLTSRRRAAADVPGHGLWLRKNHPRSGERGM